MDLFFCILNEGLENGANILALSSQLVLVRTKINGLHLEE